MTQTNVEQILADLLPWLRSKIHDKNREIVPDTELITQNLLDSMEFLELVTFLEKQYNIELGPDHMTPENFKTPGDIAKLVNGVCSQGSRNTATISH